MSKLKPNQFSKRHLCWSSGTESLFTQLVLQTMGKLSLFHWLRSREKISFCSRQLELEKIQLVQFACKTSRFWKKYVTLHGEPIWFRTETSRQAIALELANGIKPVLQLQISPGGFQTQKFKFRQDQFTIRF